MITNLSIDRFKSIRSLSIECRKVNVFIGPPDTGKTNILEALYFCSLLGWNLPIGNSLRLRPELGFDPLFFRQFFDRPFQISLARGGSKIGCIASIAGSGEERRLRVSVSGVGDHDLTFNGRAHVRDLAFLRFYAYESSETWQYTASPEPEAVRPPRGDNLLYVARHNATAYEFLKNTVADHDWKLRFDQNARTFRLSEVREDEILDYNLDLLSDSLKRFFFYGTVILTSKDATLVLDEPDVFAFPPYPKMLGQMIAADDSNQYFLTTHNPYFLTSIAEKVAAEKLALFVCRRHDDGTTSAKLLLPEQVGRVIEMEANVFFNLEDFLDS